MAAQPAPEMSSAREKANVPAVVQTPTYQGDHLVKLGSIEISRPQDRQFPADKVFPRVQRQLVADAD